MKKLLAVSLLGLTLTSLAAEPDVRIELRTLHLRAASDIAMDYSAMCDQRGYRLLASMSPVDRRPTAISAVIGEGAELRKVDITATELGRLMTDKTGFGELGFGCGRHSLYVRYLGATRATESAPAVVQDALFSISEEGVVSRQQPAGVTVTPLR